MYPIVSIEKTCVAKIEYASPRVFSRRVVNTRALTHSLSTALDRLRVVAISTTSGPGLLIDRHWWVDPYLLPPVEAKFSVDDRRVLPVSDRRCAGEGINTRVDQGDNW